jgi:hypothetical protein
MRRKRGRRRRTIRRRRRKKTMSYWKTIMCLHTEGKITETEDIETQPEIFQAGTLSPLLFCTSLKPTPPQSQRQN